MHIQLELNHNDRDALLRHCQQFVPSSGDAREDARLADALEALAAALNDATHPKTEFSSANGAVPFESDIGGSWWEANLGVDYQADKKVTFFVSAGYQKSFDGDNHSYEGMLGVKYDF